MNFVVSILIENDNSERLRAFENHIQARVYVERQARKLFSQYQLKQRSAPLKSFPFVTLATVYQILPSGHCKAVEIYDGSDPRDEKDWHGSWR